jgi:hypothetical protein
MTLSLDETARARSWNLEIAAVILADLPYDDIAHDRRWQNLGGFSIDRRDGAWWSFAAEKGGYSAEQMVAFLRSGCSREVMRLGSLLF